jgi:hypothetical protein
MAITEFPIPTRVVNIDLLENAVAAAPIAIEAATNAAASEAAAAASAALADSEGNATAAQVARVGAEEAEAAARLEADRAEDAADLAETYAATAANDADYYATIALGRAAVADGETFGVLAGGSDGLLRPTLYRRDSSTTQTKVLDQLPATEFDARIIADRPYYLGTRQVVTASVDATFAAMSGEYLDGTTFTFDQDIAVSNGLQSVNGALRLGTVEGSLPLTDASIESGRPYYYGTRQVITAVTDATFQCVAATFLDGTVLGEDGAEKLPLVALGDSLADFILGQLAAETGRTVIDMAIGGQRHFQILNRVIGVTLTTSTNTIASGSNSVTHINSVAVSGATNTADHMLLSTPSDTTTRGIAGVAGSIRGTLQRSVPGGVEAYIFTPDAGQTLPVTFPANTPFIPDTRTLIEYPFYMSIGRNGSWTDGKSLEVIDRLFKLIPHRNIIMQDVPNSDLNSPNEWGPSGSLYLQIAAFNASVQQIAGPCYVPVYRILKDRGLALASLTPNSQDATDATNDVISNQLRTDDIHPNPTGATVIARDIVKPIIQNWN